MNKTEREIATYKRNNAKNSRKRARGEGKVWVRGRYELEYSISKSFPLPRAKHTCFIQGVPEIGGRILPLPQE